MHKKLVNLTLLVMAILLSSCGAASKSVSIRPSTTTSSLSPTTSKLPASPTAPSHPHIFLIVMENLGYQAAMSTPQLSSLAHNWAYANNYFATSHPSLPNYLSLIGGSTFHVTSDCISCFVNAPNLPTELSQKNISWTAYMESVSKSCHLSPYATSGLYAGKHDPFVYFENIRSSAQLCSNIKPLNQLAPKLSGPANALSDFIWITPNLCNDGHNCSASVAGLWLQKMVAKIVASPAWKNNGALYVTWDEGNGGDNRGLSPNGLVESHGGGGHALTLVIEPSLKPGTVITKPLDHYSILKTVEDNFGVTELGNSANPNLAVLP